MNSFFLDTWKVPANVPNLSTHTHTQCVYIVLFPFVPGMAYTNNSKRFCAFSYLYIYYIFHSRYFYFNFFELLQPYNGHVVPFGNVTVVSYQLLFENVHHFLRLYHLLTHKSQSFREWNGKKLSAVRPFKNLFLSCLRTHADLYSLYLSPSLFLFYTNVALFQSYQFLACAF